jgi:hypothetical protein
VLVLGRMPDIGIGGVGRGAADCRVHPCVPRTA